MKGLILKDVYSVRFQIFGGLGILLFPNVLTWLSMFSDNPGELGGEIFGINTMTVVYAMLNYITITVCSSLMLNTINDDARSGWAKFQRTTPVSVGKIVGAKIAASGIIVGGLCVISIALNMVGAVVLDTPLETLFTLPIVFACLQMITLSAATALGYRFGVVGTTLGYLAAVLVIAAGLIAALYFMFKEDSADALRIIVYAGAPILAAALTALFFFLGKKAAARDA